jgi:hypothetical protein
MTPPTPELQDKGLPGRLPPEERFWKRYSPHHEFPLSSATSAALHVLAILLLLLSAWVAWKLGFANLNRPPEVAAVALQESGGDGHPGGIGPGPRQPALQEESTPPHDPKTPSTHPDFKDLKVGDPDPIEFLPKSNEDSGPRVIRRTDGGEVLRALEKVDQSIRKEWFKSLREGGGDGPGTKDGEGRGPGSGPGRAAVLSQRQKRQLRWSMLFNTQSGEDYARQLQNV